MEALSMINDIRFHGDYIDLFLDNGYSNIFKVSRKCFKYVDFLRKNLIGIYIFDQVTIDNILKSIVASKNVCLELSVAFLKIASDYQGVHVFEYINNEYYLPYIVICINGYHVICNDYCYIDSFL